MLKSILYRYKNTGLLGHLFQRKWDSDSVISTLYTQACLASLSDSDKEAALYLAADNNYPLKASLCVKKIHKEDKVQKLRFLLVEFLPRNETNTVPKAKYLLYITLHTWN